MRSNGCASGPVLQSVFLAVLDHSWRETKKGECLEEKREAKEGECVEDEYRVQYLSDFF